MIFLPGMAIYDGKGVSSILLVYTQVRSDMRQKNINSLLQPLSSRKKATNTAERVFSKMNEPAIDHLASVIVECVQASVQRKRRGVEDFHLFFFAKRWEEERRRREEIQAHTCSRQRRRRWKRYGIRQCPLNVYTKHKNIPKTIFHRYYGKIF